MLLADFGLYFLALLLCVAGDTPASTLLSTFYTYATIPSSLLIAITRLDVGSLRPSILTSTPRDVMHADTLTGIAYQLT